MKYTYCPKCGEKLTKKSFGDEVDVPFCEKCKCPHFDFSQPCVICLVVDPDNKIALIRQSYVSDKFVCVAGYMKQGETAEGTAVREVKEETGLQVLAAQYVKSYYYSKKDMLMLGFVCRVEKGNFALSNEVESAEWFTVEEARGCLQQGSTAMELLNDWVKVGLSYST
jgi:NAD+ diphosphatase